MANELMLDYRDMDSMIEPLVAYIDEDRAPRQVASTFLEFLDLLTDCDEFCVQVAADDRFLFLNRAFYGIDGSREMRDRMIDDLFGG